MQRHHHDRRQRMKIARTQPKKLICAYLGLSLGVCMLVLYGIDLYKRGDMSFMNNAYTFFLAGALSVFSTINGINLILSKNKCARLQKENARLHKKLEKMEDDD